MREKYFFKRYWYRLLILVFFGTWGTFAALGQDNFKNRSEYRNANSRWFFTHPGAGLDFVDGGVRGVNNTGALPAHITVSHPKTKALQFYTDGQNCYNANHQVMQNGGNIAGDGSWGPGYAVAPLVDSANKYYLFSVYHISDTFSTLYYSVIDMDLNNGLGDVAAGRKNVVLANGNFSKSLLIVPGDNCDLWLVTHAIVLPEFKVYQITGNGINPQPVVSVTGSQVQGYASNNGYSPAYFSPGMCVSPDRTRIATASFSSKTAGGVLVSQFNTANGVVSSSLKIAEGDFLFTQFSPDSRKLYAASFTGEGGLIQWNLSGWNEDTITRSRKVVAAQNAARTFSGNHLRLYNDTIYLNSMCGRFPPCDYGSSQQKISIIANPNNEGQACNFIVDAIALNVPLVPAILQMGGEVVHPLPPDTIYKKTDTLICTQNGSFPSIRLSGTPGLKQYIWEDGTTTVSRAVSGPGHYRLIARRDFCSYESDSFVIRQSDISFNLGPDAAPLCGDNSFHILSIPPGAGYKTRWQDGSTANSFVVTQPGTYWVALTNPDGCMLTDTVVINARESMGDLGPDHFFCKGEQIQVTFTVVPPVGTQVQWSTGSTEPSVRVGQAGTYWVEVKDTICIERDTVRIVEEMCSCVLQMPNAFSPNGDGLNDFFQPIIENGCNIVSYAISIYNRYGQRVYNGIVPATGWDGTYNGIAVDAGTYFYHLVLEAGTRRERQVRRGDIVLIR